jgi:hypothetical protein
MSVTDSNATDGQRFYRVVLQPPPPKF